MQQYRLRLTVTEALSLLIGMLLDAPKYAFNCLKLYTVTRFRFANSNTALSTHLSSQVLASLIQCVRSNVHVEDLAIARNFVQNGDFSLSHLHVFTVVKIRERTKC
jgi:stage V sporulation protein SpoVS